MIRAPQNYEEECKAYREGRLAGEPVFEKPEGFDMTKETADLLEAGHNLATAQSHDNRCLFHGCTCGVMEVRKKALAEYWKRYRINRSFS
jgi:hypothetical protein